MNLSITLKISDFANKDQIKLIKGGNLLSNNEIEQLLNTETLFHNYQNTITDYIENAIQEIIKNQKNNYRLIISFEQSCGTIMNIKAKDVPDLLNIVNNSRRIEIFEYITLAERVSKILKPFNKPVFYIKDDNHNTVATLVKDNPVDVFVQNQNNSEQKYKETSIFYLDNLKLKCYI